MSFPKAKLLRFNDVKDVTPSPADYDIKMQANSNGAVIPKSNRFADANNTPSDKDNASVCSANTGYSGSVSCFRTPTAPRRHKLTKSSSTSKLKTTDLFMCPDTVESLKEKIVECNNKDIYIKDLIDQIEEMKQQICALHESLSKTNEDKINYEDKLAATAKAHENSLAIIQEEHNTKMSVFSNKMNNAYAELQAIKAEYKKLKHENHMELEELLKNMKKFESLYNQVLHDYNIEMKVKSEQISALQHDCIKLQADYAVKIDSVQNEHQKEVEDIEFEMLKNVTEANKQLESVQYGHQKQTLELEKKMESLRKSLEEEKIKLLGDFEAKLKLVEENLKEANLLSEIQMRERVHDIETNWKLKLEKQQTESDEILKECQAISEYNIFQCVLEKKEVEQELEICKRELEECKTENQNIVALQTELESRCKVFQNQLSKVIGELNNVRNNLGKEVVGYKQKLEQASAEQRAYEMTICKTHITIEALKKRLIHSDNDVEQLKEELKTSEKSKLEYEDKCNQLLDELQLVSQLCEDFEIQNERQIKTAEEKIRGAEHRLLSKVDCYEALAQKEINDLKQKLIQSEQNLRNTLEQLHDQQETSCRAQILVNESIIEIEKLENELETNKDKNLEMERKMLELESKQVLVEENEARFQDCVENLAKDNEKMKTVIELMQTSEDNLVEQIKQLQLQNEAKDLYKAKLHEYEADMEDAAEMRKRYIELSGKYDQLFQKLEDQSKENGELKKKVATQATLIGPFTEQLIAYEAEYNALISQKLTAENELKQLELRYAEKLGHQNQKQKIKYMVDLKKRNLELTEGKKELENKVKNQTAIIAKLKKELDAAKARQRDKENIPSPLRERN